MAKGLVGMGLAVTMIVCVLIGLSALFDGFPGRYVSVPGRIILLGIKSLGFRRSVMGMGGIIFMGMTVILVMILAAGHKYDNQSCECRQTPNAFSYSHLLVPCKLLPLDVSLPCRQGMFEPAFM